MADDNGDKDLEIKELQGDLEDAYARIDELEELSGFAQMQAEMDSLKKERDRLKVDLETRDDENGQISMELQMMRANFLPAQEKLKEAESKLGRASHENQMLHLQVKRLEDELSK